MFAAYIRDVGGRLPKESIERGIHQLFYLRK